MGQFFKPETDHESIWHSKHRFPFELYIVPNGGAREFFEVFAADAVSIRIPIDELSEDVCLVKYAKFTNFLADN